MVENEPTVLDKVFPTQAKKNITLMQVNRAERRRLKRALKLPFTPTAEFTAEYLEKMSVERATPERVKVARAFEGKDDLSDS